jgi:hypothetical protein
MLNRVAILCALALLLSVAAPAISQTRQQGGCVLASPGVGFPFNGGKIVITSDAFATSDDVQGRIKAQLGNKAALADWQILKSVLSRTVALTKFIDQVGIPRQFANGPCDNFLVAVGGNFRLGNGLWWFLARHDGYVPSNWAVLDSIGDHTLDLGRWSYTSQALAFIPDEASPRPIVAQQPPATPDDSAREAERQRELGAAKRDAEQAERQRQADVATAEAEKEKAEQLLASERQWEFEVGSIALGLVLLLVLGRLFAVMRIKRRTSQMAMSSKDASVAANVTKQTYADTKAENVAGHSSEKGVGEGEARITADAGFENPSVADQVDRLAKLHTAGTLSKDEFETLKNKVVSDAARGPLNEPAVPSSVKKGGEVRNNKVPAIVVGVVLILGAVIAFRMFSGGIGTGSSLQVTKGSLCDDSSNPDCSLRVVRMLNKASEPIRIGRVTVNDKPQCFYDVNTNLGMGNGTTITAFGMAELQDSVIDMFKGLGGLTGKNVGNLPAPVKCGDIVKMTIETDKGTYSFFF